MKSGFVLDAYNLKFCQSHYERDSLINKGYAINGDSLDNNCILNVKFTSFTATPQQNKVLLQWQTATETNNNYFTVQHSINGKDWNSIATVQGSANSSSLKIYQSFDIDPKNGINYYRIKQTDFNGRVSYSEVRSVEFTNDIFSIYPNPVSSVLYIVVRDKASMKLYDAVGKQILVHSLSSGINNISLSHLSQGTYIVMVENNNGIITKKIIKH